MEKTNNTKKWLRYWRNSLTDSEVISSVPTENVISALVNGKTESDIWLCDKSVLKTGQLDPLTFSSLQRTIKRKVVEGSDDDVEGVKTIPIIISPYIYISQRQHTKTFAIQLQTITPLWTLAFVGDQGALTVPEIDESSPIWIRREYLAPNTDRVEYGHVDRSDEWLTKNVTDALTKDWTGYLEAVENYYRFMGDPDSFEEKYKYAKIEGKCVVMACSDVFGMVGSILQAYASLVNQENDYSALLNRYCAPHTNERKAWWSRRQMTAFQGLHLGHMNRAFGLSPSQRQALFHSIALEEGGMLAINGPPGTGKTTLIQDVLATILVRSALAEGDPPVTVVASTGNQAVTNVIDSFSASHDLDRWLPEPVSGLGIYLTNSSEKQKGAAKNNYLTTGSRFDGFPKTVQTDAFVAVAEDGYLKAAKDYFGRLFTKVDEVLKTIHAQMIESQQLLDSGGRVIEGWLRIHARIQEQGGIDAVNGKIRQLDEQVQKLNHQETQISQVKHAWEVHKDEEPLLLLLFAWIPPVRRKLIARDRRFISEQRDFVQVDLPDLLTSQERSDLVHKVFNDKIDQIQDLLREASMEKLDYEDMLEAFNKEKTKLRLWLNQFCINEFTFDESQLISWETEDVHEDLQCIIDRQIRHKLFNLAIHYWEGRWIIETKNLLLNPPSHGMFCYDYPEPKQQGWRRLAMLTPCFVVTLHSAPTFFNKYDGSRKHPHAGVADWLILDESGQIRPDIAAPTISIGRRALVVGDVKQLEPVYGINEGVDEANAMRYGVAAMDKEFVQMMDCGMASSSGSVMRIAQSASLVKKDGFEPGMFLAHHRRCLDSIIGFCNELSYGGRIVPLRGNREALFPPMGYAHIKGRCESLGSSRINQAEAETIVQWLIQNKTSIEKTYGGENEPKSIGNHVGIITPFRPQGDLIKRLLRQEIMRLGHDPVVWGYDQFKIGTVDALQGAERDIVLFSSVYTTEEKRYFMLDDKPNRLNVAVSRAKDSFLLFGDMEIFDPTLPRNNPRGLLARHLTATLENVPVVPVYPSSSPPSNEHEICTTIDEHRAWFRHAFADAKKAILIVSPFLSKKALDDDNVVDLIKGTLARGVTVKIIVDDWSVRKPESQSTAEVAFKMLKESGAKVLRARNIHTKLLCVDVNYMIKGSFNWLSAERTREQFIRHDTSMRYHGPAAKKMINMLAKEIQDRVVSDR